MEKTLVLEIDDNRAVPTTNFGKGNENQPIITKSSTPVSDLSPQLHRDVFCVYNNECISMNVKTDMAHRIYMKKTFGVTPDEYAKLVRGYMKPGQIIFYKTTGFTKVSDIPSDVLNLVLIKAIETFGTMEYNLYTTDKGKLKLLDYKCSVVYDPKSPSVPYYLMKPHQIMSRHV